MFSLQRPSEGTVTGRHSRRSFTLIELLMVIVIISILMSLAFAAFNAATRTARIAEVKVEISAINGALADFKAKFGFYPPSRIVLREDGVNWDASSRAVIRRMFPQFNFTNAQDINRNNVNREILVLTGAECLVFFLGGVQNNGVPIGFSTNPSDPFLAGTGNRIGPFFEFNPSRVKDIDVDGDGMRELVSPLENQTTPYLYVSAYDGRGYPSHSTDDICDLDVFSTASSNPSLMNMSSVYLQGTTTAWSPNSFQIICPGFDNKYGLGGKFDPETADLDLSQLRESERDNITSFHSGLLSP
jgi:prepilin-type N-terminal cleavage/methylation domain-containing protein